jgi:hypothetical protein
MITENEQDELIFDFLEGNLSADEKEAFLILKDESEVLSRQVRLWENTYLQEALPSVDALEKKLLIRVDNGTRGFSSRIYGLLIMMLAFLPVTGDKQETLIRKMSIEQVNVTKPLPQDQKLRYSELIPQTLKEHDVKQAVRIQEPVMPSVEDIQDPASVHDLKMDAVHVSQDLALQKIKVGQLNVRKAVLSFRKQWSRLEKKQIRKKKWKDSDAKHAAEFMKGNVPYVVPLNSNNF